MRWSSTVRAVALLEAAKGALVLLAGFAALSLIHHDAQRLAEQLVGHLHLNPAKRYPRIFIDTAAHLNDARLWLSAILAGAYGLVRFVETYGLWKAMGRMVCCDQRRHLHPLRALRVVSRRDLALPRSTGSKRIYRWPNGECIDSHTSSGDCQCSLTIWSRRRLKAREQRQQISV